MKGFLKTLFFYLLKIIGIDELQLKNLKLLDLNIYIHPKHPYLFSLL